MTTNPYQAPTSDVSQEVSNDTYQPKIFSINGRIGRLRYLAYSLASYIFLIPGAIIFALGFSGGDTENPSILANIGMLILGLGYIALLIYVFVLAKRRFNDLNKTGWMSALLIIPLVNVAIGLWLMFGKGTQHSNQYGAKPCENPLSVKIFGLLMPLVFIIGMLAAIALPAYSDYVERAKQAESFYQE